jgi:glycosyltransferase involved in cell wall biosynthesis
MKISFVIPAFNEEKYIAACLQSVAMEVTRAKAKHQDLEVEVVVVNNNSSDKTKEVAGRFANVRVVDEPIKGLPSARKAGFEASSGELVANIDADSRVPEGWLDSVIERFKDPKLVALTGPYIYYDFSWLQNFIVKIWYFPGWLFNIFSQLFGRSVMLQGGNFVLRRDAWARAGGFDASIAFYGEDADVARRMSEQGKVLWTWSFPMFTSARRLKKEGLLRVGYFYFINLLWTHITGRPWTNTYTEAGN